MMKYFKVVIYLLLLIIPAILYSNNDFLVELDMNSEVINCCINETGNDHLIISITKVDGYTTIESGKLLLMDDKGNIVNQVVYENEVGCGVSHVEKNHLTNTWFIAYYCDSIGEHNIFRSFLIDEIDQDLEVLNTYPISQHQDTLGSIRRIERLSDSCLVVLEDLQIDLNNALKRSTNIVKYNMVTSNSVKFSNDSSFVRFPFDIMVSHLEEKISLFYNGNIPGEHGADVKILDLDFELNPISYFEVEHPLYWYPCVHEFSDSVYLISGVYEFLFQPTNREKALSVYKMNFDHDTLNGVYYYPDNPEDTVLYPMPHNTIVMQDNKICVGGIYNLDMYNYPNQPSPCWVQLTLLDYDLNIEKQIYYGDGIKAYYGRDIIATSDGGFAVCGLVSDQNASNPQPDLFVLKVNSEGLITGNNEIESPQMTEVIIWPNPGSDVINLKSAVQLKNAVFELYNTSGNLCHTEKLSPGITQTINAAHLSQGVYTYRITDGKKLVKSGKWIKE